MSTKLNYFLNLTFMGALLINSHAYAQAMASVKLEHFKITLVDLDLTDGITPAITYNLINNAGVGVLFEDAFNTVTKSITDSDFGNAFPTRSLSSVYDNGISFASAISTGSVFNPDEVTSMDVIGT